MSASRHWTARRTGPIVLVVLSIALAAAVGSLVSAPALARDSSSAAAGSGSLGAASLSLAEASLAHGAGPALGTDLACKSAGEGSVRCATDASVPQAAPAGGYSWTNLTSTLSLAPKERLTQMTWDSSDGYVVLFGGISPGAEQTDTWTFANGTWTNITASTTGAPPSVYLGGMAFDPASGKVVLFGGVSILTSTTVNYTWTYHAKTWTNITSTLHTAPSPRALFSMTTDTTNGEILLFGGTPSSGFLKDTWTYKNGTWTNITSSLLIHMPALIYPALSDYPGHGAFLIGAFNDSGKWTTGTYTFSGGQWTNITSTLSVLPPPPVTGFAFYLPALSGVLEFSTEVVLPNGDGTLCACAWLFTSTGWQNVSSLIGSSLDDLGTVAGSAAYVPLDQSVVTFGGERLNAPPLYGGYTWVLSAPPSVTAHASKSVVDAGQAVTFSATVSGGLEPNKVAWSFGDGGTSSNLSQGHTYAAAGFYTATVKATDFVGANSSASVSVQVNAAPTVAISSSANATAGSPVGLAAVVAGGTGPFTYAWTLGDSSTSTAAFVSHVYANAGTYAVNVTITDSLGATAHATVSLVVASAPSSSSSVSLTSGTGLYLLLGIVVLLVVVVLLAVMLMRKPKSPTGAPTPYSGPTSAAPPPPGPPPGATGPPPGAG